MANCFLLKYEFKKNIAQGIISCENGVEKNHAVEIRPPVK
jgi:hypothetical protein